MKIIKRAMLSIACVFLCGCNHPTSAPKLAALDSAALQQILKNTGQKVPDLKLVSTNALSTAWHGQALAKASFVLRQDKGSLSTVPEDRIEIVITRYASTEDAQKSLEEGLRLRPAAEPPRKNYKGTWLYRYTYGGENAICQAEQYIIEIAPAGNDAKPLTMKVLDIMLAELASAPAIEH